MHWATTAPRRVSRRSLLRATARVAAHEVDPPPGEAADTWIELGASDGRLRARIVEETGTEEFHLAFYRDHYVVRLNDEGQPTFKRSDFLPGPDGRIAWFRLGGRLFARQ